MAMKKINHFFQQMAIGFIVLALAPFVFAEPPAFIEGQHYQKIEEPVRTRDSKKVEVVELFWYGCPHCFKLEPALNRWIKDMPEEVDFFRSPAIFNPVWKLHAQAYYTGEALQVTDKTHEAVFHALHKEKKKLKDKAALASFYADHGVKKADFEKTFDSFGVRSQVKQAEARAANYGIRGVPAVVVNGKYRVSVQSAGSEKKLFEVVDYLIQQEKKLINP